MDKRPGSVGTLAAQIRGHEVVRQYMTSSFLFLFADMPFALLSPFLWVLGGAIVLVPLTLIPIGILIGLGLRAPLERYTALAAEESNKRNGLLVEALDGIETVKAVGSEWDLGRRWESLTERVALGDFRVRSPELSRRQPEPATPAVNLRRYRRHRIPSGDRWGPHGGRPDRVFDPER